ncbi:hypothetical protein FE633_09965 [Streptomyces montanus]|uniref:Secreted protein n=1 Tax=Streptomyces montanus TaxID=2580423 RepID=A0A5R9FY81_9ACTN|nr:hypothetical protein [Streptomyces montanus]TLS46258.1 hypothetical protein FE633_09965 [Streptomyces montanus]
MGRTGWGTAAVAGLLLPLTAPSPATADDLNDRKTVDSAGSSVAAPDPGPVPEEPEYEFTRQCAMDPAAQDEGGRVYNRGVWCQNYDLEVETSRGTGTMNITAVAYADSAERRVRVFLHVNKWESDPLVTGLDTLQVGINCKNQCTVRGDADGEYSGPVFTWVDGGWVSWDLLSPNSGVGVEKMLQHQWQFTGRLADGDFALAEHRIRTRALRSRSPESTPVPPVAPDSTGSR